MNRKALIFSISLVLITLGTLVTLVIIINNLEKQISPTKTIGERAIDVLNLRTNEEQTLFFISEAAKIAAEQATQEFLENAGLVNIDCGKTGDVILWNTADKNCFETNFYENYETIFNKKINPYLETLSKATKQTIHKNNYALSIKDGKTLSGIAVQPIENNIITDTTITGLHAFKPVFTIPFEQDFTFLPKLRMFARQIIKCADSKDQQNKEECIQGIVSQTGIPLTMRKTDENTFVFDAKDKITFAVIIILS